MFDSKNVFLGPILYFKAKSYTKGVLWLLLITTMLFANFFAALVFWIISGLLGKRKLEIKQDDTRNKLPYSSSGTHKSSYKKYHRLSIPRLNKIPEGPENGIAGFIDVETTGLSARRDEIIEFAISLFCFDRNSYNIIGIVDSYCGLREPSVPISPEASKVNGIYMRDVKGKDLDYNRINEMLEKADFFVSHNANFDRKFVRQLFPSVDIKDWLCSMNGINWYDKGFHSKGLQNLLSMHGIRPKSAHRAFSDVESAIKLLSLPTKHGKSYFYELMNGYIEAKNYYKNKPGYYNGKHYTEYAETIRILRREGEDDAAEKILLKLLDAIELESKAEGHGVAPWYYEQLAIIYRKRKDYHKEIGILERFAKQKHAPGVKPPRLLERLKKAKELANQVI